MQEQLLKELKKITKEEHDILKGNQQVKKSIYTKQIDFIVDNNLMLLHGKVMDIRTHTRFVHFPRHRHNYIEIIYMCSGKTTHIINDTKKVVLTKGDLLFLNQNATQEIMPAGEEDVAVNFIVLPEFFDTAIKFIEKDHTIYNFLIGSLCQKKRGMEYIYFKVADILPVQNLIENMIWSIVNNQTNRRNINQTTMGLLMLELTNHTERIEQENTKQYEQSMMFSVLRYIQENYRNGTLTELAAILNQSIPGLSGFIKKQTNQTFLKLMQEKRMSQAAFLLKTTDLTVEDIMIAVGYDNSSYFHRMFKEKYSKTPKHFRRDTDLSAHPLPIQKPSQLD